MMVVVRIATGVLLAAHGLVHLLYLVSDVPEFSLDQSWLVPEAARRPLGLSLMAATVAALRSLLWRCGASRGCLLPAWCSPSQPVCCRRCCSSCSGTPISCSGSRSTSLSSPSR
jgi:hypothetical protein